MVCILWVYGMYSVGVYSVGVWSVGVWCVFCMVYGLYAIFTRGEAILPSWGSYSAPVKESFKRDEKHA